VMKSVGELWHLVTAIRDECRVKPQGLGNTQIRGLGLGDSQFCALTFTSRGEGWEVGFLCQLLESGRALYS
jgi:hypothetical protein